MSDTEAPPASSSRRFGAEWRLWLGIGTVVGVAAFLIRLVPVLRGGGIRGFYNYDPAVYYAAAAGMAHGLLPYRDFLLLHPPGVPLALLPFALIGRFTSDSTGMALARIAIMAMGAATAVLLTRLLKPAGAAAALVAGLAYAVYWPAVYVERAAWLEGFGSFLTVVAMVLLVSVPHWTQRWPRLIPALAGAALGLACMMKVWSAVILLAALAWLLLRREWWRFWWTGIGAAIAGAVMMLPFLGVLPQFWQMVVGAQFGRVRGASDTTLMRMQGMSGLDLPWEGHIEPIAIAVTVIAGLICLAALTSSLGRFAWLLTLAGSVVLATGPTWFRHYPVLVAVPLMVCLGAGFAQLTAWLRANWQRHLALALATAMLAGTGLMLAVDRVGTSFSGRKLAELAEQYQGCVTTDDPNALIAADLLKSNLAHDCPFVIDLSGYRYYLGDRSTFRKNKAWQDFVQSYLSSGSLTILLRGTTPERLDPAFYEQLRAWPVVGIVSGRKVRAPQ